MADSSQCGSTTSPQPLPREAVRLWFWTITSDTYPFKRMKTTWRMTEDDARARHGDDAVKVEGSVYVTEVGTSSYQPPGYTRGREPAGKDDELSTAQHLSHQRATHRTCPD